MSSGWLRRWAYASRLKRIPPIVIDAPTYTHLSSGVRCLHLLCHWLNRLGISAAVTARSTDARLDTPRIHRGALATLSTHLDRTIVIYPEVTAGNPLGASNVVRYLLNVPGIFTGVGAESYGADDYYLHFADEFVPAGLTSRRLRLPLVDTTVFAPPPQPIERQGFLVYSARYQPDVRTFPGWIDRWTALTPAAPHTARALAKLYQSSRALIVGERTAAVAEALHCHCPVIVLPHGDFAIEHTLTLTGGHGIAIGFDASALALATGSAPHFAAWYAAHCSDTDAQILAFVSDATRYFGLPPIARQAP